MRRCRKGLAIALCVLWPCASQAVPPPLPRFPPLEFHPPKPERVVLPNGLTVFLLEDHELPLIKLETMTRAGSQYDPPDKVGLSGIFGESMAQGGSAAHTPEEIERLLDTTAASIDFSVALENATGDMSCRAKDFDQIFGVFTDLLLHPQFRKDRFEIAKGKALEDLRRLNDDPEDIARREFRRILYGKNHPYARIPSPETIGRIRRDDLLLMHQKYFHPNETFLAVSGDFNAADMRKKIEAGLGSWPRAAVTFPPLPAPAGMNESPIYYTQWPINQSQIRMGQLGLARHNPDHFAWEVFNELWGGTATSRLFQTVRTREGLAYSVGSGFWEPSEQGILLAVSQTRAPETIEAVKSMIQISRQVTQAPFTPAEIKGAKDSIINRFVENYTSSAQIVDEVMEFEYYGFPPDYLDHYTGHISQVSGGDLARVGKAYLHPDQFKILIVGDLSAFNQPISSLGAAQPIRPVDYSRSEDHP